MLARATITSIRGLRASIFPSQDPDGVPCLIALRTTELAPMISRRRSVRSPIFEIAPSFCLPPLECCDGVSRTQAAKSRPLLKASAGGANAANAVAITGPTPGMVVRRRTSLSSRARRATSRRLRNDPGRASVAERAARRLPTRAEVRWIAYLSCNRGRPVGDGAGKQTTGIFRWCD